MEAGGIPKLAGFSPTDSHISLSFMSLYRTVCFGAAKLSDPLPGPSERTAQMRHWSVVDFVALSSKRTGMSSDRT